MRKFCFYALALLGVGVQSFVNVSLHDLCDLPVVAPTYSCIVSTAHLLNCSDGVSPFDKNISQVWPFPNDPEPINICSINASALSIPFVSLNITSSGSLSCINVTLCQLWIDLGQAGTLNVDGVIAANTIKIYASSAVVTTDGRITSSALGLVYGSYQGYNSGGGSHGGSGGSHEFGTACPISDIDKTPMSMLTNGLTIETCCRKHRYTTLPATLGSISEPDGNINFWNLAFGSGGGINILNSTIGGRSGGRIGIYLTGDLIIEGIIDSDGETANAFSNAGSGSGGTVVVSASNIFCENCDAEWSIISARGGGVPLPSSPITGGAGGGGRVVARIKSVLSAGVTMTAAGGMFISASQDVSCYIGSAGTVFISLVDYNTLKISNDGGVAYSSTMLDLESAGLSSLVDYLSISNQAEVVATSLKLRIVRNNSSNDDYRGLYIDDSTLTMYAGVDSALSIINTTGLSLGRLAFINSPFNTDLQIFCDDMSILSTSGVCFQGNLDIYSSSSFRSDADIDIGLMTPGNRQTICTTSGEVMQDLRVSIFAGMDVTFGAQVTLDVPRLVISANNNIFIVGEVSTKRLRSAACPAPNPIDFRASCGALSDAWPSSLNYTTVLVALMGDVSITGAMEVNSAAICGLTVSIEGTIDASGLGCESETGWGQGKMAEYAGSGAGHVGFGGDTSDGAMGGDTYDDPYNPLYPGSGGGNSAGSSGGGPGGGYILLSGKSSVTVDGIVTCAGDPGDSYSGGGSGGSINVITVSLLGSGTISVVGGDGDDFGGGGGSGGSIRFKSLLAGRDGGLIGDIGSDFTGVILASGGQGRNNANNGANGTIISTNCAPGFQFYPLRATCVPCGFGFWRNASFEGTSSCQKCSNAPPGGTYISETSSSDDCPYTCAVGTLYPDCLSPFAQIAKLFGGELGFTLTVSLLSSSVVIVLLFLRCQRLHRVQALLQAEGEAAGPGGYSGSTGKKMSTIRGAYSEDTASSRLLNNPRKQGSNGPSVYKSSQGVFSKNRFGRSNNVDSNRVVGSTSMSVALSMLRGNGPSFRSSTSVIPGETRKDFVSASDESQMRIIASSLRDKETCSFLMSITALQEKDLPLHMHRIYLSGSNTLGSSWRLPWEADKNLGRFVRPTSYAKFAARVNELLQWPRLGWEEFGYVFLSLLFPPYAHAFLCERRRARVILLLQAALACEQSHSWVRGAKARALQDCLRVGISSDYTLAYVDILGIRTNATEARRMSTASISRGLSFKAQSQESSDVVVETSRGPLLPLVLLFSGDGTFENPFFLDANDVLVRSVPSARGLSRFVDNEWVEFVAEINARSRCLTAGAIMQTSGPLLSFLRAVNKASNDSKAQKNDNTASCAGDLLGGLDIQLMRFWPAASSQFDDIGGQEVDNTASHDNDDDHEESFVGDKKLRDMIFENTLKLDTEVQKTLFGSDRRMSRAGNIVLDSETNSSYSDEEDDSNSSRRESTSSKATTTSSESDDDTSKKREQRVGPSSPRNQISNSRRKSSEDASALDRFGFGEDSKIAKMSSRISKTIIPPTSVGDLYESNIGKDKFPQRSDERDPRSFGYAGRYSMATQELFQSNDTLESDIYDSQSSHHSLTFQAPAGSRSKLWWANRVTSLSADVVSTSDSRLGLFIRLRSDGVPKDSIKKSSTTDQPTPSSTRLAVNKRSVSNFDDKKGSAKDVLSGALSAAHWSAIDDVNSFQFTVSDDGIGIDFKDTVKSRSMKKEECESPKARAVLTASSVSTMAPDMLATSNLRNSRRMSVASFEMISSGTGPVVTPPLLAGLAYGSFKVDPDFADLDAVLFSCLSEVGNAVATSLVNLLTNFNIDAGGNADVEGKRVNMTLPYPGLPLNVESPHNLYWTGEDVWCCGSRLSIFSPTRSTPFSGRNRFQSLDSVSTPFMMRVIASAAVDRKDNDDDDFDTSFSGFLSMVSSSFHEKNSSRDRNDSIDSAGGSPRSFGEALSVRNDGDREFFDKPVYPAPPRWLMTAGINLCNIFSRDSRDQSGISGICALSGFQRALFALSRVFTRTVPPLHPTRSWLFYAAAVFHICLLLTELALTVVIVAQISCIQPASDISSPSSTQVANLETTQKSFLVIGDCSFVEVSIYLLLPPLTCLLSPLAGLAAIARGSSRALRTYSLWNVVSLLTALIALILVVLNIRQLGVLSIIEPCLLLVIKVFAAQLVPVQLSSIECTRPVRGWQGLFEVRELQS
jgi:hypothetical protein